MGPESPRTIGLWPATALVVGHTIGVGIFLTPAELAATVPSPAILFALWIVCGAMVFAGALTFGELAARYPSAGGLYIYLREAWGPRVAFLYAWQSLLIMDPGITAALSVGAAPYVVALWPAAAGAERAIALALIWLPALGALSGIALSTRVMTALTVLKVAALIAIVIVAFGRAGNPAVLPTSIPPAAGIGTMLAVGLASVFFSFGGFWEAGRIADLVHDPARTMPRALGVGVVAVTALYIATSAAFVYLVPPEATADPAAFARAAGTALLGPPGPAVLSATVVISVAGSVFALVMMAPRLYVAMSRDGVMPLAALRSGSPGTAAAAGTLILAALASAFVWIGTFRQIMAFFMCSTLAFVALAAAALVPLRRQSTEPSSFTAPAHPMPTLAFVALLGVVIGLLAVSQPRQALAGCAVIIAGVLVFPLAVRRPAVNPRRSTGAAP